MMRDETRMRIIRSGNRAGILICFATLCFSRVAFGAPLFQGGAASSQSATTDAQVSDPIYYYLRINAETEQASPEALLKAFMDRHTSGEDYEGAVEMAYRLIEVTPDRPVGYYNLACSLSLLYRTDESLENLEKAVDLGWRNLPHTLIDPDLSQIRNDPRFEKIARRIRREVNKEKIRPVALRNDEWGRVVSDLQMLTPGLMERYHVPGVSVALVRDGQMVWSGAFGMSDEETEVKMTEAHGFKLRAPSHLLALIGALQQEKQGGYSVSKLLLEANSFDQEDPARLARLPAARPAAYIFGTNRQRAANEISRVRNTAYIDRWRTLGPEGWPSYKVSNTSFVLLQNAIEESSRQTFYNYCRENIFNPLLLEDTRFVRLDEAGENPATGHTRLGTPIVSTVDRSWRTPVVYTTATDMGRLIEYILAGDGDGVFLDEESSQDMLVSRLGHLAFQLGRFGLGVHVEQTKDGPCVQLADNIGGIGCLMRWYPRSKNGIVVMFNAETGPDAALRIAHLALGGR